MYRLKAGLCETLRYIVIFGLVGFCRIYVLMKINWGMELLYYTYYKLIDILNMDIDFKIMNISEWACDVDTLWACDVANMEPFSAF